MSTYRELKEALNQGSLGTGKQKAAELFLQCRQAATAMHIFHLATSSYAAHMASNAFYDGIIPLVDKFAEAFIGRYGKFEAMPNVKLPQNVDGLQIAVNLLQWIDINRGNITDDSEIQNVIDEISDLCSSTTYKLRELK
nr:MAG: hypothetical protein [Caudoviricetes sp.]